MNKKSQKSAALRPAAIDGAVWLRSSKAEFSASHSGFCNCSLVPFSPPNTHLVLLLEKKRKKKRTRHVTLLVWQDIFKVLHRTPTDMFCLTTSFWCNKAAFGRKQGRGRWSTRAERALRPVLWLTALCMRARSHPGTFSAKFGSSFFLAFVLERREGREQMRSFVYRQTDNETSAIRGYMWANFGEKGRPCGCLNSEQIPLGFPRTLPKLKFRLPGWVHLFIFFALVLRDLWPLEKITEVPQAVWQILHYNTMLISFFFFLFSVLNPRHDKQTLWKHFMLCCHWCEANFRNL